MKQLFLFLALFLSAHSLFSQVIISEVYAGGGNSGAPYKNDYVVLYNPSNAYISLTNWSVQYATSTGSSWTVIGLSNGIASHGYYLIQLGSGGASGSALMNPDVIYNLNISVTGGKVALLNTMTALTSATGNATAPNVADYIGWGSATDYEGATAAPAQSNTMAVCRSPLTDTNNNGADFVTASPVPRNSAVVLTLDLTAFTGHVKGANHQLEWKTDAHEGALFEIQHATNGIDFQTVGELKGDKNNADTHLFTFDYATPSKGINYYRLQLIEVDGKTSFSKIISVENGVKTNLKAYPTLATDHLTINVDTEGVQTYYIFNLNGQSTQTGDFTEQKDLFINTLSSGIYFLKVGTEIAKFTKQ